MIKLIVSLMLLSAPAFAQSKLETFANIGARSVDTAQTCYYMHTNPAVREQFLPTQSCAGIAGFNFGFAFGSWAVDRWLVRHHHARIAHFQIVSAVGAGTGIAYTSAHAQ